MQQIRTAHAYADEKWQRSSSGLYVPACSTPSTTQLTCVDLFCGAGGFSLGVMQAGMKVIAACDHDASAAITYLYNLGQRPVNLVCLTPEDKQRLEKTLEKSLTADERDGLVRGARMAGQNTAAILGDESLGCPNFFFGDIRKLTGQMIFEATGLGRGEIGCVIGGPPCQGFTTAGKRNVMDPRNSLVFEFARLVLEIQPMTMVMENVPGIVSMVTPDGLPVVDVFCRILEDGGWGTVDAIKRSLGASSGAGALLRKNGKKGTESDELEEEKEPGQMSLFTE